VGFRRVIENIIYGRQRSILIEPLLSCLGCLYSVVLAIRDWAFRIGFLRMKRLPYRVLSIGNITLGGTGKTPTVINAASLLRSKGARPVILSRGYGRQNESSLQVVSDGMSSTLGPDEGGDEPAMIAARLPTVPIIAGKDRYSGGLLAFERFHPDVAILDDGYQHRRLVRDLNIVLLDGADPFGNRRLFPAGILREPLSALSRADAVVITRADEIDALQGLRAEIGRHTTAPVLTASYVPGELFDIVSGRTRPAASLRGGRVFAFAGIARPESFFSLLRSLGAQVSAFKAYPDHYRYGRSDLAEVFTAAVDSEAVMIITTEKDAVRLSGMAPEGIWALRVDIEVRERDTWEALLTR
jgi:tetraacyldisaccharide 4'-kinase